MIRTMAPRKLTAPSHIPIPTPRKVRAVRKSLGLTQESAAAKVGISRRTWQDYERGQNPIPPWFALLFRFLENGTIR